MEILVFQKRIPSSNVFLIILQKLFTELAVDESESEYNEGKKDEGTKRRSGDSFYLSDLLLYRRCPLPLYNNYAS